MKKVTIILALLFSVAMAVAQSQNVQPMLPCCDNGFAECLCLQADSGSTSVKDIYNNCLDVGVTPRQCVDRTRDRLLCSESGGSRYCHEVRNVEYPRYYALYHPMIVSTSSMTFAVTYGTGNPSSQVFSITNGVWQAFQIDRTLDWSANKSQNWLSVSPSSGNVSGTTPASATVSVNVAGLARGTYSDVIGVHSSMVSSRQWETISGDAQHSGPVVSDHLWPHNS